MLDILSKENKYTNTLPTDISSFASTASLLTCLEIVSHHKEVREKFKSEDEFSHLMLDVYSSAMFNYFSIVNDQPRQVLLEEAQIFYCFPLKISNMDKLVSLNKSSFDIFLSAVKSQSTYGIVTRNDLSFVVIDWDDNDFIVIDPCVSVCGLFSDNGVYQYTTYNGVWDFTVQVMLPDKSEESPDSEMPVTTDVGYQDTTQEESMQ